MDFENLLDQLYQSWSKTTGANEDGYHWYSNDDGDEIRCSDPKDDEDFFIIGSGDGAFAEKENVNFIIFAWSTIPTIIEKYRELQDDYERLDVKNDELKAELIEEIALRQFEEDKPYE